MSQKLLYTHVPRKNYFIYRRTRATTVLTPVTHKNLNKSQNNPVKHFTVPLK